MRLYLMRHGQAVDRDDPLCPPDPERPLTARGRKLTRQAALGLKWLNIAPRTILTSPHVRARQTAEIVVAVLGRTQVRLIETDDLLPGAPPHLLRTNLRRRRTFEILCVGHLPHLDTAIAYLLEAPDTITELKKAGVAALDLPARGAGTLMWLLDAKMLRKLASK